VEPPPDALDGSPKIVYKEVPARRNSHLKVPQLAVYGFITALLWVSLWQTPVFSQEKDPFYLAGQTWGKLSTSGLDHIPPILDEANIIARRGDVIQIYRIFAEGEAGVTLLNHQTGEFHLFPIASQTISRSKNYLFILPTRKSGFFVLHLADLYHFGFHSPIPLFFIPLDPTMGPLKEIIPQHTEDLQEETLRLVFTHEKIEIEFQDIRDVMKAQLISLAATHMANLPPTSELALLVVELKHNLEQFYEDLHQDLERLRQAHPLIPKDLETLNWEQSTVEELSQALAHAQDFSQLQDLKSKYAQRFSAIVETFNQKYTESIQHIEFSFSPAVDTQPEPESESKSQEDKQHALQWIGGITIGVAFITLVLPKFFKKPFSVLAEKYCYFHYKNTSWVGYFLKKLLSSGAVPESPSVARTLKTLLPQQEGLFQFQATGKYFKRSFAQLGGDTATVVATELLFRPLQPGWRTPADVLMQALTGTERERLSRDRAILIDDPFDEHHSLWLQKNFLERIIGNQILGTINTAVNLQFLEREYNAILRYYIVTDFSRLAENQKQELAKLIHGDLKEIQDELSTKIQKIDLAAPHAPPALESLDIEKNVARFKEKWANHVEALSGPTSNQKARAELEGLLEAKIRATYQATLSTMNLTPQRVGFMQKCLLAFNQAAVWSLSRVFGERLATKSLGIWTSMNEPYLWNGMMSHFLTRGSFNATQFLYRRSTSLVFTTPFWIASYQALRNRGMIRTDKQEFLFGLGYGFVTNLITHFIFVYGYENHVVGTVFDLEFSKLFNRH